MTKYYKVIVGGIFILAIFGLNAQVPDLCKRVDMKPVLSLEQIRMAELVDFVCELAGIKKLPSWPTDISGMTPEQYYQMEVKMLVDNGFPPVFLEIEPERLVNRRFFASLMFQIAMDADPKVREDCKNATTETEQFECLLQHDWIYSTTGKIYQEEILSILCEKKAVLEEIVPPPVIKAPEIYPQVFPEAILPEEFLQPVWEEPATPF